MRWIISIVCISLFISTKAQTEKLSIEEQLAAIELELDSISIFNLIDSILNTPAKSEIGIRFGYSSSRLTAGRDFNLNQEGYAPGISYYHKSGFYGDWTTYLDNQSDGALNLSILHVGYFWLPNKKLVVNPYAEKTFNHQNTTNQLTQSLGTNATFDFKIAEINIDYAFLWGRSTGQRILPSLTKSFTLNNVPLLKKVKFYPNVSLMAGTTTVLSYLYSEQEIDNYILEVQSMTDLEIIALRRSGEISTEEARELILVRRLLNEGNPDAIAELKDWLNVIEENQTFDLLSYTISLPVSFYIQKFSVMLNYSYSFPQKLPGEILGVDPSGFFSFSVSRRFSL